MEKESLVNRWKRKADELKLQLHLGSKDLADRFEEDKKNISAWAAEKKEQLKESSSEKAEQLKIKLEELELQAALGRAESRDALEEQQKKISKALRNARDKADEFAGDAKEGFQDFAEKADAQMDTWQAKFEMLQLQLKLGAADASDEWEARKKELAKSIHDLENKISEAGKQTGEGWNHFKSEMSEAWTHIKGAFSKN